MELLDEATREELILTWLRSEWHALPSGPPADRALIDNPDLTDAEQNGNEKGYYSMAIEASF
jgi:hypothetical protein